MNINYIIAIITKSPFLLFYLAAFVLSVIKYPKYYSSPLKYFPAILLFTLITETLGGFILFFKEYSLFVSDFYQNNTFLIFNIYDLFVYPYLFYIFWKFVKNEKYKNFILYGALLYIIVSILNLFTSNFIYEPQSISFTTGGILLIGCILLYYKSRKEQELPFFGKHDLLSWIGLGYFIFYIGFLPLFFLRHNIFNSIGTPPEPAFFRPLHYGLIIVMYISICLGFILMNRLISRKET